MNRLTFLLLFFVCGLLCFAQGRGLTREGVFGTRIDVVPVLVTYAALRGDFYLGTILAVFGGLLLDSLSATPVGVTLVSLSLMGLVIGLLQGLVLRDQALAQAVLGGMVSGLHPVLNVGLLWGLGFDPVVGWGTLVHIGVMGVSGAILAPFFFLLFDWLEAELTYEEEPFSRFRSEVEIKRGRG